MICQYRLVDITNVRVLAHTVKNSLEFTEKDNNVKTNIK